MNIVISGGAEAALVAPLLKEKNIPVDHRQRADACRRGRTRFTPASYQAAARARQGGRQDRVRDERAAYARNLPYHAAMSVAWGLDRDEALKALTINAAEILGVADRIGSLEAGKDANLFISKGDPLEVQAPTSPTW